MWEVACEYVHVCMLRDEDRMCPNTVRCFGGRGEDRLSRGPGTPQVGWAGLSANPRDHQCTPACQVHCEHLGRFSICLSNKNVMN